MRTMIKCIEKENYRKKDVVTGWIMQQHGRSGHHQKPQTANFMWPDFCHILVSEPIVSNVSTYAKSERDALLCTVLSPANVGKSKRVLGVRKPCSKLKKLALRQHMTFMILITSD